MKPIRVLVVDDSASMRALIRATLVADKAISVVGEAADPLQAREAIKALNPDVMTLDVEMPRMNGIEFLEKVMRLRPLPVIMISSLTERGASVTISAMEIGAVDCVAKPTPQHPNSFGTLAEKVKAAAGARLSDRRPGPARAEVRSAAVSAVAANGASPAKALTGKLVAIGASTGGVEALVTILAKFPRDCAPTVITIHLPAPFTRSFAQRLDRICAPRVHEAAHGAPILPGNIYVAPGTHGHLEVSRAEQLRCVIREGDLVSGHRPSVDALFHSVAKNAGAKAVGVILTGMGADGAQGLLAMRKAGARTIGQSEASCVVYGMPKVAFQVGAVEKQAPLNAIAAEVAALTTRTRE
jgi:two-component system chemotaxis response regulator CheB